VEKPVHWITLKIYNAKGRFGLTIFNPEEVNNMTNTWKCAECGYQYSNDTPHEECPSCKKKCEMLNVTCYIPECGSGDNTDQRL
jgi:rubrerythrin